MRGQGKNALGTLVWAAVAIAAGIGLGASGGLDGKAAPGSAAHFKLFDVKPDEPKTPVKKKRSSGEPPPMTCEGDQCWWTELGRPSK